ncbi:MAG TPA: hypothetical protein VL327_12075 [Pyrinomonadaceae bacterium]|jgi:hypothetical protein|nr:hypothetical protein [Pyrinomonadaceae bacterium]
MSDIELRPTNLHWQAESDPFEDCCLHGGVYLKIGSVFLSDGVDIDWTVSAAAFNLLNTLRKEHMVNDGRLLIPHCGHTMWVLESEPDSLYLGGCDIGINWTIQHEAGKVVHKLGGDRNVEMSLYVWQKAVCQFSDEVFKFFMTAWPKNINDEDDLKGFELFMSLWRQRRAAASN